MNQTLIISNCDIGDVTFDSDRGTWNVTRALRDCLAGKHETHGFDISETIEASRNVEVDESKIVAMAADPERLSKAPPLIFVVEGCTDTGQPIIWLIDGHHRVRALARLGFTQCAGFVIEENDAKAYRIYFNGERVAPWIANARARSI